MNKEREEKKKVVKLKQLAWLNSDTYTPNKPKETLTQKWEFVDGSWYCTTNQGERVKYTFNYTGKGELSSTSI